MFALSETSFVVESPPAEHDTLDPSDWPAFRAQAHRMLDDILDYTEHLRERPVWQPIPPVVRDAFRKPLPEDPADLAALHETFLHDILPYSAANAHPRFMGWVQGGGTPVGMLAEMLAAGLNANLGGRDQIPLEVERQVVRWVRDLFGFPETASGLFVTGASMANLLAVLVARSAAIGPAVRRRGVAAAAGNMVAYTSSAAHGCIAQAMDLAGLGTAALRIVPVNQHHQIDIPALDAALARDKDAGLAPFLIAATAGTVDVGAVDDLTAVAAICRREKAWFHVDGAYGALGMLAPRIAPRLAGIELADSLAFDFHKWGQVPYDAGFLLVRDGTLHYQTFASPAAYLSREARGMSAGSPWPCDFGPDLSRGFRALKTWFTIQAFGAKKLGAMIAKTCDLAQYLKQSIENATELELLAPVALNIVCFRYRCEQPDRVNREIVIRLQESGIAAPSTTMVNGCLAIRAAIVNHRTNRSDIDALVRAVIFFGSVHRRLQVCIP